MITYDRYTELLSRRIHKTATPADLDQIREYETAQPEFCPKCHTRVRSQFMPAQIVHDIEECQAKPPGN